MRVLITEDRSCGLSIRKAVDKNSYLLKISAVSMYSTRMNYPTLVIPASSHSCIT